jgi:alanine transaminase
MVGQYPGQTPEVDGPTSEEVEQHIRTLLTEPDIGVSLFCSLQSEIPPQTDYQSWNKSNGKIYLEDDYNGSFPNWFSHYAPIVHQFAEVRNNISRSNWSSSSNNRHVEFLHHPIEDLSIPEDSTSLQSLLLKLLTATSVDNYATIYVHCWGGRGRAGLTAACLLSLVYPELDGGQILDWIQTGYDSRLGATAMPRPLSRSPQTESQRQFVRDFVNLVRLHHNKDSGKVSTK